MQNSGGEIKAPATAEAGTTVEVEVQGDSPAIEVSIDGSATPTIIPVGPDRKAQIPVPPAPGSIIFVTGTGKRPVGQVSILITSTFR